MKEIEQIIIDTLKEFGLIESPFHKPFIKPLAKAIEQYVKERTQVVIEDYENTIKEIESNHEQYVIKARIEELERLPTAPLATAMCLKQERIAELKKGLNENTEMDI